MNNHHYTGDPSRVSPLFFEHPELRTRGGKGLFNYARPEVREHYLKLAAEVLERYDVDGLELDWIRTAANFNDDEIDRGREILTDFVRAVHRETQAAAKRRGHPVQLAVRVPAKPEFAHGLGFDVAAWAREGLVDMMIPSDYWNGFADLPVEDWRAQIGVDARQCRIVPFTGTTYACTKGWMVNVMSRNLAAMRGFAASMLDRGADGIYFFNNFQPVDSPVRLRTPEGKEGWVKRKQMELTLLPTGEGVEFDDPVMNDVLAHRFEFGFQGGDLDGANLISAYLGYALTTNFTAELRGSRGLGDYSNTWLASANLTHTFFPKWRVSPFFSLGTGLVHTEPKSTLVQTEDRTDQTVHAAAGVRAYLTRRFIFRAEYRNYMVLTSRDDNEEVDEWTAGFSVFF